MSGLPRPRSRKRGETWGTHSSLDLRLVKNSQVTSRHVFWLDDS
jgi:hypothetical protein